MPMYEFQGEKTGKIIERFFHMGKCPEHIIYYRQKYNRIFSTPTVMVDTNQPKTIGSLADKNTREREKRGLNKPSKKQPRPFWRPHHDKPRTDLLKKTPAQLEKYIYTGK
jgi:hypothetical protein